MSTRIHAATLDDLPVLQPLCISLYTLSFGDHWNEGGLAWYTELVYGTEQLTKDLTSHKVNYFMLSIDDVPHAFMKLKQRGENMEIQKLYVRPDQKGKGLGKRLMNLALSKASELGKKMVWLEVLDTNYDAIGFYEQFGFKTARKIRLDIPYFKDELRGMLIMELVL
ncbi:MAG TPA: GNAT family N-acetyltransferase [Cyclobacteriaceae bacterium]|nr:GNAT family N-acetyltransferase [Cyclobacteriaceae bacterium]